MILGRTSGGKIQTKTDGGTRAVNCACCGGGCRAVTLEQYNAVAYGGTANLAGLSSPVKNLSFSQLYSSSYPNDDGIVTYGEVEGTEWNFEEIGQITCDVPFPPDFGGGTYPVDITLYRYEEASISIFTTMQEYNDGRDPKYFLTAAVARAYISEDYECDPENPFLPKQRLLFESEAFCGPELYRWLMEAGPPQTI